MGCYINPVPTPKDYRRLTQSLNSEPSFLRSYVTLLIRAGEFKLLDLGLDLGEQVSKINKGTLLKILFFLQDDGII